MRDTELKVELEVKADVFYFPCHKCGKREFLIRGLCSQCAPALHYEHKITMAAYGEAQRLYEKATEKTPLSDFDEFDRWRDENGIKSPFVRL